MTDHAILTADDHRELRVKTEASGALGDAVMSCFTIPAEFRRLQNEFPILFRRDAENRAFSALALLGFEAGVRRYNRRGSRARARPLGSAKNRRTRCRGGTAVRYPMSSLPHAPCR
jgi:hypothetical protein